MTAKKTTTKAQDRLSNAYKKNKVRQLIMFLLREEPSLTQTDIRRIFNYGYRTLWKNGKKTYKEAWDKTRPGKGSLGLATARAAERGGAGDDKGLRKIWP